MREGVTRARPSGAYQQTFSVSRNARSLIKNHSPMVIWFTGLSAAGKSTVANSLERLLNETGKHTFLIDGDNVRLGLNRDLGFMDKDRSENVRRVAEVARLMSDAGLIVLVAMISPFAADRVMARSLMVDGEFIEVFVDTPLDICAARDPKGLYQKALAGEIECFTGVSSPYEAPTSPEVLNRAGFAGGHFV